MLKLLGINLQSFTNSSTILEKSESTEELEKGKKMPIGTVSNGYKKVAEGKWQKVSQHKMTKKEHQSAESFNLKHGMNAPNPQWRKDYYEKVDVHRAAQQGLDDKEYDDAHVFGSSDKKPENAKEIGKTKSGKTIYDDGSEHEQDDDFTAEDHEEAADHIQRHILGRTETVGQKVSNSDLSKYYTKHKEKASAKKTDIKKSVDTTVNSVGKEELQKSHINWNFRNSENLTIYKKGADIKEKLISIKSQELLECQGYQSKLEALKVAIGKEPCENVDEYVTEGLDIQILPKVYNWSETYSENEVDDLCKQKREYNEAARNYVKSQSEIILIDTMVNNLDDSKMYQLTVQQAAILKF